MNPEPAQPAADAPAGGPVQFTVSSTVPEDWDLLAGGDPAADFFHFSVWSLALGNHCPQLEPLWLVGRQSGKESGRLVAGLAAVRSRGGKTLGPLRLAVTRLESHLDGVSGGPLVAADLPEPERDRLFLETVAAYADLRGKGLAGCHLSLNPQQELRFGNLLQRAGGWQRRPLASAILDLAGGPQEVAMTRMAKNKRNERNRALRKGAEVFATDEPSLLQEYYPLYAAASRHWGKPALPLGVFTDLLRDPQGRVFLTCVRLGGKVIGGHLNCSQGRGVVTWNGVTDPAYARSHFPSTLAIWGDIEESCRRGADWLDLGSSGGIDSLVDFKKHCGAEEKARGWYVQETCLARLAHSLRGMVRGGEGGAGGAGARWHDRKNKR